MCAKIHSDGLGGFQGVSQTLRLGAEKRLRHNKFYLFLIFTLLTIFYNVHRYNIACYSINISSQSSNEIFKNIKINQHYRRTGIPPARNTDFTKTCIHILFVMFICCWLCLLLLVSGDIHPNPGPASSSSTCESSLSSHDHLSNHLSIFHLNVQSLLPKIDILRAESEQYDIAVFSESWLKPHVSNDEIAIRNFLPPFRNDRLGRPGGGVLIYARDTLLCPRRRDIEIIGLEAVWVEVTIQSKKFLIGGMYRPPGSTSAYFNLILESIDRAFNTNIPDIIITGDFNYNMLPNNKNKINDLLQQFNLHQMITDATHFTETSATLIDLMIVRNTNNVLTSGVDDPFLANHIRYHCPVFIILKFVRPRVKPYKRKIWNYKKADFGKYRQLLSEHDLVNKIRNTEPDTSTIIISDAIFDAADKSIPNKIVNIYPNDYPWITSYIKYQIRKRKRLYNKFKQTNMLHVWNKFKITRNKVIGLIRKSKRDYFDKLEYQLNNENLNSKLFWKTSKQLLKLEKSQQNIPTLILDNEIAETDLQKANMLNKYFSSQSTVDDNNKNLPLPKNHTQDRLELFEISPQTVKDVLSSLNVSKSCGPDLMSPRLLKEAATILAEPYSVLFTSSLRLGHYPSPWKDGNITALHKKDDRSLPSNYRPISLLCQAGKAMERCVHKELFNYINDKKLLTPFQSGFVPGDSTTFQLLHTYHTFCEAVDSGKEVRVVFCDISKAFDRVWHMGLIHKLRDMGCSEEVLKWFSSYLTNRRQRVVNNGQTSEWTFVKAGVPQGSILGPLLFLIYINDIVIELHASVRLFADDTSLYIIVENPITAAFTLSDDLNFISTWASDWLVRFNATKTLSIILSLLKNPPLHPTLYMNNTPIATTASHKHLGLTFSNNCSWNEHINNITKTAYSRLNLLRALKFKVNRNALEKMYISFIRPLLEYSDSVWDNASTESKKQLEAVHNEAARIITGATKLCSIKKFLTDLGWESLQSRRSKHKLILFYKMVNGLAPEYLQTLVPPTVQNTTSYNLRNANNLRNIRANTNLFYNSFLPSTIRAWNDLSDDIKAAPSVASFKHQLNKDLRKPPTFFNSGTRRGQILHARLRMDCSSLNAHLHKKNIVPSPSCSCGAYESVYHFFFKCPNYTDIRNTILPNNLNNLNTNDLLYGIPTATDNENDELFSQVQDFIIHSNRFV